MIATLAAVVLAAPNTASGSGSLAVTTCGAGVFGHAAVFGINTYTYCPPGDNIPPGMTIMSGQNTNIARGEHATWQATAPAGLAITGASIAPQEMYAFEMNDGNGWGGGFYWAGGGAEVVDGTRQYGVGGLNSPYFGFQIVCGWNQCDGTQHPTQFTVERITLYATETTAPGLSAPTGLWHYRGWVRGTWPLNFSGDSPSGICSLSGSIAGISVPGSTSVVNPTVWHQCSAPPVSDSINTWDYGQGPVLLTIRGTDAAGVTTPASGYTKALFIDNTQPSVSFSGPSDAPSTAGTQNVIATGSGSPSGIDGLSCSVDGGPYRWSAGRRADIPVAGIGDHDITCMAANNAVDGRGRHGWSKPTTHWLSIRQPTVGAIGFSKLVDALRCRRVRERVKIPARWVTVVVHHHRVRIHERAHTQTVRVRRCRARVVHRRITVWAKVRRKGKVRRVKRHKTIRVVVLPHIVNRSVLHLRRGKTATVSGWLGSASGTALGGQKVVVLAAADNGLGHFKPIATTTTAANGSWAAVVPAGPSRLIEAQFPGTGTLEPYTSAQVRVLVPAKVELISIRPRHVPWGGTIRIVGRLVGGYLPPGGALVRLRIGYGSSYTTYGVKEHVGGNGRFRTTYTFGLGQASVHRTYWFQLASLPMGNYPWQPAASRRISVSVGGT